MFRGHVNRVALRGRIVGMHESGKTAAEISRELGVTKDTVYLWIRRWQEEGNLTDRRRQGRPRETTNDQDEEIREAAEANPFTNAVAITEDLNLPVSGRTVRRRLHDQERFLFIQDRCPIHTSWIVQRWFREHPEIELMDWPSKGCDMNPIENIWGNIVNTWEPAQERTSHALLEHALREWEILRRKPDLVREHVESMPRRLQQVIEKEGGWTKY
ncbi:hypothetical protein Pmani_026706 [Petrolisthes manimaculis]|uniref:Tc1-like transposase DDE domain-containing protein n=1 Tax=Petrolisthes manimaculis TaxID=1843537 RepID=A0AAE1P3K9_9EUCA|nr:hypothetical protein Pmani_026706 [Petrolisthes manimaculis]